MQPSHLPPTLSVIMGSYNYAHYIGIAIEAMATQSYKPLEIIIIEDCSSDNSSEIISGFAKKFDNIIFVRNKTNIGGLAAANMGLNMARGDYVYFAAADDMILPGFFEKSMELISSYPSVGFCMTDYIIRYEEANKYSEKKLNLNNSSCFIEPSNLLNLLLKRDIHIASQTIIMKRSATASHNPMDYNGMKLVREDSKPISGDTGLNDIRQLVKNSDFPVSSSLGTVNSLDISEEYISQLMGYVDSATLRPLKVVVNAGNGCAGPVLDLLEKHLPFTFIKVHHVPDGSFPNGIPNPLLPENRSATIYAINEHNADVGIAWDGDFDRCFLFDGQGRFIEGYYIVGLLAAAFLKKHPHAKIIHDPRLTWNTIDLVQSLGGTAVVSKTGHAFIKERMRAEDAVYGGEMSAHHYFRDFAYCDSGMIPWLLVLEMMCTSGKPLSELLDERMLLYPASGEINRTVSDPQYIVKLVTDHFSSEVKNVDYTDGVSLECGNWRFNLRSSNTEPVLRLNVESRGDHALMRQKTDEILSVIDSAGS